MKILFIGNSEELNFELTGKISNLEITSTTLEMLDHVEETYDGAVIFDKEIPFSDLRKVHEKIRITPAFYVISYEVRQAVIDNKTNLCHELGIIPISSKLTAAQKTERIVGEITGNFTNGKPKKIATFFSTHSQTGLSNTVFGTAAKLTELSEYSVVVLSLTSSNPPGQFFEHNEITLNELYTQISNNRNVIRSSELKNLLYKDSRGFYFLAGNQDYTKRNHYHINDIEFVIDMLYDEFDIVLIDAGHDPDTALTIQALLKADMKFLNVTQQPVSSMLWRKMGEDILERHLDISPEEFQMIVNFYSNDIPKREIRTLESEFGIYEIARIPDCGIDGVIAEVNQTLLSELKTYKKVMHTAYQKLAMAILQRFNLLDEPEQGERNWLLKRRA
ncbi:hypothetical protein A8L34_27955 [Bacillus sp. FJAT-27264]|uniref:hypothetical protein n=1 Tax=Paenibacillus sp. (strain DSM 101736 / FJAT-27264) TaxID=1850362 RepID=UPI000807E2A5|nr:hypothetical protein [Bacillus sp. FJAT-27264]OBZ15883.1 hypothetical protein A8L34_27955 [Bacillus sp. FJAT-27264]